jgi:hypothetical protein
VHRRPRPHPRRRRPRATALWSMSEGVIRGHPVRMAVRCPRGPVGPREGQGDRSLPCGSKVHCLPPLPRCKWAGARSPLSASPEARHCARVDILQSVHMILGQSPLRAKYINHT